MGPELIQELPVSKIGAIGVFVLLLVGALVLVFSRIIMRLIDVVEKYVLQEGAAQQ